MRVPSVTWQRTIEAHARRSTAATKAGAGVPARRVLVNQVVDLIGLGVLAPEGDRREVN